MRFSDRIGVTQPKQLYQSEDIDDDLKNQIWNVLTSKLIVKYSDPQVDDWYCQIIGSFLKKPIDSFGHINIDRYQKIRSWYFSAEWYQVYNFIQFVAQEISPRYINIFNNLLEAEKSAYRFVDGKLVPITDDLSIKTVAAAAALGDEFSGPRTHIKRALDAFAKKPKSDYLTAIKEAISSVEGVAKVIAADDKATLAVALNILDSQKPMHPAFKESFKKLYGWTSDEKGIRHALMDDSIAVDEADAQFMIVACSAFVNFVVSRYS